MAGESRTEAVHRAVRRADHARRVAGVLRRQIAGDGFPGGRLPEERLLAAEFGVSRNAVREALALLAQEGVVERRRGIGTLVRGRPYRHPLAQLAGLAEVLHHHGDVVNTVREARRVRPPADVARKLRLEPGDEAVYLERLRRLDGAPLSLDSTYLLAEVGDPLLALERAVLEHHDVFHLIETVAGAPLGRAEVSVQAVAADPATREVLGMPEGGAVLAVERLVRLADGRPADVELLHLRGDRLTLHAELDRPSAGA